MGCGYIFLPALFLLFYQRASVWATCQRRDPQIRWTDRCPMPVLALSLFYAFLALSMSLPAVGRHGVLPLFGVFLSGISAAVERLLLAVIYAFLAWGMYKLKAAAWWGALLVLITSFASVGVAYWRLGVMAVQHMNLPESQLELMRKTGSMESISHWQLGISVLGGTLWLGYLLFVRRYFVRRGAEDAHGL
jgi:hypothetical protein